MKSKNQEGHVLLNRLFIESADDLLSASGIKGEVVTEPGPAVAHHLNSVYVSVSGATGLGLALSSMLTLDRDLLVSLHPLGGSCISEADLEDWCRELNNQLVGRVKNRLLRFGIPVTLGLPVLMLGAEIKAVATPDATLNIHQIQTPSGNITLSLSALIDEDLEFVEQESGTEDVMFEGAVVLF